ncbi:sulfite exporter TauE/SafE family protein [Novosphingobium bradum]|uniref:Probable membrane transporter protein n=1 Tax=Novosphingobium bradum TaxID=1737444 RepID=A0ABV7IP88_9SPHN
MDPQMIAAGLAAGAAIGLVLGLVGGGGSIIAVPLLVYLVGVASPHAAIGTAAVAVALNALAGLAGHARAGTVKWPCALTFSLAGVAGATMGAHLGKAMDGQRLLALFGAMMVVVGLAMLRPRRSPENPDVRLTRASAGSLLPRLVPAGLGVGLLAGFFGIGGGFLIVPALIAATGMPLRSAVGTSLVSVAALGLTTAASYALSGYVEWGLVALLVAGGLAGALIGIAAGKRLAGAKRAMEIGFALLVVAVGAYVVVRGLG